LTRAEPFPTKFYPSAIFPRKKKKSRIEKNLEPVAHRFFAYGTEEKAALSSSSPGQIAGHLRSFVCPWTPDGLSSGEMPV
jgi:hypothetical protein